MDIFKGTHILVTGGAGFIGSHIVDALLSAGAEVTVVDIKTAEEAVNLAHVRSDITYVEGTILDQTLMDDLCSKNEYVIHLAAIVSVPLSIEEPLETHRTNALGTLCVFEAARRGDVERVVYASSAAVYGDTETVPVIEDTPLAPLSPYGLHKVINEQYARLYGIEHGLNVVGLRFFNVFGTRQDPSSPYSGVISIFAKAVKEKKQPVIFGDGTMTRDFVHVDNIVNANLSALMAPDIGGVVCNVGSGEERSINDLVAALGEVSGTEVVAQHAPERPGDLRHSCASIKKAQDLLGYSVVRSFKDGLKDLI